MATRDVVDAPTRVVDDAVDTEKPPRTYEERKVLGWCTYGACPRRAQEDSHLCKWHGQRVRAKQRRWVAAKRTELAGQGKCRRCRKPSTTVRCPACRVLDGCDLPPVVVARVVDIADPWRRDNDGWQRYRGKGRRGPPPAQVVDDEDLKAATESLERGRTSLAYANSDQVRALGKDHHKAARAAAASILGMASRMIEDVATRNLPVNQSAVSLRSKVREALGEGVDNEVIDDRMIDRVIAVVRGAEPLQVRGRR